MTGKPHLQWQRLGLRIVAAALALILFAAHASLPAAAASGDRTLWLHHTHTGKSGKFTFRRNGQYDPAVLRDLNVFLADWRTGSVAKMDPALYDLLWEVYQEVGGKQPYNIVSSYREPKTNAMLASKSSGVADNSLHMQGKAMDVFIPGVKIADLRAAAMRHQVGGVGYYPTSGSPFVHMDTGSVRAWPRMTRAQLKTLFPDGRTLHLPVDGTPLSNDGRRYAEAEWKTCKMVPCDGRPAAPAVQIASLEPSQRAVATVAVTAPPAPMARPLAMLAAASEPADMPFGQPSAPLTVFPAAKSAAMMVATRDVVQGQTALGAIAGLDAPLPAPRRLEAADDVLVAYAPDAPARSALDSLIARETAATPTPPVSVLQDAELRVASLGAAEPQADAVQNIFDMTWSAVSAVGASAIANTLVSASLDRAPVVGLKGREFDLVAPELDHVNETLVEPVPLSSRHFAVLYEPEGYLDNAADLGPLAGQLTLVSDSIPTPRYDSFVVSRPLLLAAR